MDGKAHRVQVGGGWLFTFGALISLTIVGLPIGIVAMLTGILMISCARKMQNEEDEKNV
jgi:hypothetical protein